MSVLRIRVILLPQKKVIAVDNIKNKGPIRQIKNINVFAELLSRIVTEIDADDADDVLIAMVDAGEAALELVLSPSNETDETKKH